MISCPIRAAAATALLAVLALPAPALEETAAPASCDLPQHHQLDFWIGDWQVFDGESGPLVAFDHVEKTYRGCVVEEHLTFLTDMYRRPGVELRLAGIALNRFDGESWLQMWADNQWGAIVLRGAPNADGSMEFRTVTPSRHRDVRLVYRVRSDGTLEILQYVAPAGSGKWTQYGDLIYRRNH